MKYSLKKKKRRYSDLSNIQFVFSRIWRYEKKVFPMLATAIVFSAVGGMVPVIMPKWILAELIAPEPQSSVVVMLSVLFGGAALVCNILSQLPDNLVSSRFISVRLMVKLEAGKKFMSMDYQNLEKPDVLDLAQRGFSTCDNNNAGVEGVMHAVRAALVKLLTLLGVISIVAVVNPLILLLILGLIVLNAMVGRLHQKKDKKCNDALAPLWRTSGYLSGVMSDFSLGKDIRLFSMEKFLDTRYGYELNRRLGAQQKIFKIWKRTADLNITIGMIQEAALYLWLCLSVLTGSMALDAFTMYMVAVRTFASSLNGFLGDINTIKRQNDMLCDFREFLDLPDQTCGTEPPPENLGAFSIEFQDVWFQYPGQESYALKGVTFRIEAGEKLAVVGLNGAGKSTFIKLLLRLYEPVKGKILINGKDAATYDRDAYYTLFAPVFQEIQTFAFTVAENISMQQYRNIDFNKAAQSAEKAGFADKMESLPGGLNQPMLKVIDEQGVEFSGGETQKLALARALYKDAPCIVLDEPTAALDALAEQRLYQQFDRLTAGKTAIYISHRLASTKFCDRIALFNDGKIVETGSHEQLLAQGGHYAEIFQTQAKYYKE